MENNIVPIIAKKAWNMFRKGFSKTNLMMELNFILKRRGKLVGKAIANVLFHHHNHGGCSTSNIQFSTQREYEFSCSNTPNHHIFPIGGKRHRNHDHFYKNDHAPPTVTVNTMRDVVLEIMKSNNSEVMVELSYSTPALPLSGVRQGEAESMVDKKAEEFIKRFYKELRKQD